MDTSSQEQKHRPRVTRRYATGRHAPEHLQEWVRSLPRLLDFDDYHLVERQSTGLEWARPDSEPSPPPIPTPHRSGLCFDNESTEMRAACVDPLKSHLDAEAVIHEVRHQYDGYHTDLVYADLDSDAAAIRFSLTGGSTDPLHDPVQRFRVWWYLHRNGPLAYEDAIGNGGRYADTTENRKHTDWLLANGYAARSEYDIVTAVVPKNLATLHAVELKLRDWEKALEQADRANRSDSPDWRRPSHHDNYGYADYRWVALDAGAIVPALEHREEFLERGVGLLAITEGGSMVQHIDAEHDPRGRYTQDRAFAESRVWSSLDSDDLAVRYDSIQQPEPQPVETEPEQSSLTSLQQ